MKNRVFGDISGWTMILTFAFILCLAANATAEENQRHWYVKQGKGRPLCEALVKIANANPSIDNWRPNIPWRQVLAIKGVSEPTWKELAPGQYESFFLKARKVMAAEYPGSNHATLFTSWFLAPKEQRRGVDYNKKLTDEEALRIYRFLSKEAVS
jgi:hypothetical protein